MLMSLKATTLNVVDLEKKFNPTEKLCMSEPKSLFERLHQQGNAGSGRLTVGSAPFDDEREKGAALTGIETPLGEEG